MSDLLDHPGRTYLELPVELTVGWVASLRLPDGPVLVGAWDVESACPVAVMVLAQTLAGRHVGFLGLDFELFGHALLRQTAMYAGSAAA